MSPAQAAAATVAAPPPQIGPDMGATAVISAAIQAASRNSWSPPSHMFGHTGQRKSIKVNLLTLPSRSRGRGRPQCPPAAGKARGGDQGEQEVHGRFPVLDGSLAIRIQTAPQTAPQLVKYQAIITQLFSSSYPAGICMKCNSAFRLAVARDNANLIPWNLPQIQL